MAGGCEWTQNELGGLVFVEQARTNSPPSVFQIQLFLSRINDGSIGISAGKLFVIEPSTILSVSIFLSHHKANSYLSTILNL